MRLTCSNGHPVKLGDTVCPVCGQGLGIKSIFSRWTKRATQGPRIACLLCGRGFPATFRSCPHCGASNSVKSIIVALFRPAFQKIHEIADEQSPQTKRHLQRTHLIISIVLAMVMSRLASGDLSSGEDAAWRIIKTIIYIGTALLLTRWLMPQKFLTRFLKETSWVLKLALLFNYITCLALAEIVIGSWLGNWLNFAGLISITFAGIWVFCRFFWLMSRELEDIFQSDRGDGDFDHRGRQGRRSFWERN